MDHSAQFFDRFWVGETRGLSEKNISENVCSVSRLLNVVDLESRWKNGRSSGDENLDYHSGCVEESGPRTFWEAERSGRETFLRRRGRSKRSSLKISAGDASCLETKATTLEGRIASSTLQQVQLHAK